MSKRGIVLGLVVALVVCAVAAVVVAPRVYDRLRGVQLEPLSADSVVTPTIGGQTAYIAANDDTGPRPLLLFMHGRDADHEALTLPRLHDFAQALVDDGWVVAASDAHFNAWGSDASQDDYAALRDHLLAEYDVDRTVVLSESMGAIAGLNLLADDRLDGVDEWVGVSPVVDLAAATNDAELAAMIDADTSTQAVAENDPRVLPASSLDWLDLTVAVATDDEIVPSSTGIEWAEQHGADLVTCTGGHVAEGCYDELLPLLTR